MNLVFPIWYNAKNLTFHRTSKGAPQKCRKSRNSLHVLQNLFSPKSSREKYTHIGGEEFCIPAVTCIMRHLIEHVLSEANLARVGPNLQEEQVHSAKKVPHGLGTNNFLVINEMQVAFLAPVVSCKVK